MEKPGEILIPWKKNRRNSCPGVQNKSKIFKTTQAGRRGSSTLNGIRCFGSMNSLFLLLPREIRKWKMGFIPFFLQAGWDLLHVILHTCAQRTCIWLKKKKNGKKGKKIKREKIKKKGKKIKKKGKNEKNYIKTTKKSSNPSFVQRYIFIN